MKKRENKKYYLIIILLSLTGILTAWIFGEGGSFIRAQFYLRTKLLRGEKVFADVSWNWLNPKIVGTKVKVLKKDSKISDIPNSFWALEHWGTGIQQPLYSGSFCWEKRFGWRPYFRLLFCQRWKGESRRFSQMLRRAEITRESEKCRWEGKNCRFGPSWRRVAVEENFESSKVPRRCIFSHPYSEKWLKITFRNVKFEGGISLFFGFRDGYSGEVPLTVRVQVQCSGSGGFTTALREQIPHRPRWHVRFLTPRKLGCSEGAISFQLYTERAGGKPFCWDGYLFSYK